MNDTLFTSLIFYICAIAYVLCLAVWRWRENRNNERISPGFKLLRGPGESLRQRIAAIDDKLFSQLYGLLMVPILLLMVLFHALFAPGLFSGKTAPDSLINNPMVWGLPFIFACVIWSTIRILRLLSKRRNLYLGYFGERVVSESIDTLRTKGAHIFHDVPLRGRAGAVNIDHVIVSPGGIFAVETKTRRKGRVREGRADGKIIYDGAQLAYPWGEDTHGISQAMYNALWLDKNIDKTAFPNVTVQPILTFPGWRIEQTASESTVRVLTPAQIPLYLDTLPPVLSAGQIKHIAQQLEALCRDVEF